MALKAHDVSDCHKVAMQAWGEFKLQKLTGATIYQALDAGHAKTVEENRRCIRAEIDVLLYTAAKLLPREGTGKGLNPAIEETFWNYWPNMLQNILSMTYRMNNLK